jgi:hypothetical protein
VKTTIIIKTNLKHPMRPLSIDPNIADEYAYRVTTPKPLHVRAAETFGKLQIDPRRIEKTPSPPHHRPPWIETANIQYDFELCSIGRGASGKRFRQKTAHILNNKYKNHTKIYTVIWNHRIIKKRIRPQNTIFSAEQDATLSTIYATMGDPERKLIATNSLSTLIAASDKKVTKNPKTRKIRKLLEQEGDKNTLLWVPSHVGIPRNEKADKAAKEALDEQLDRTEEYPPQDLAKWIIQQLDENQQTHWEQNDSEMRNPKTHRTKSNDTSAMKRNNQVVMSRLRTGYTRATHSQIINHKPPPECLFCNTKLNTDHILWTCKETEEERNRSNIISDIWKGGKKNMEKLIAYVKRIQR